MNEYVPGLEGVPATKSNISFIDGAQGILSYRGYPLEVLAERSTFEETVLLLLDGNLPTRSNLKAFDRDMRNNRRVKFRIRELMRQLPPNGHHGYVAIHDGLPRHVPFRSRLLGQRQPLRRFGFCT